MASKSSTKLALFTVLLLFFATVGWCGSRRVEMAEAMAAGDEGGIIELVRSKLGPPACRWFPCHLDSHCRSHGCTRCNIINRKCVP